MAEPVNKRGAHRGGGGSRALSADDDGNKPPPPSPPRPRKGKPSPDVGDVLKSAYEHVVREAVPPELLDLLGKLD